MVLIFGAISLSDLIKNEYICIDMVFKKKKKVSGIDTIIMETLVFFFNLKKGNHTLNLTQPYKLFSPGNTQSRT